MSSLTNAARDDRWLGISDSFLRDVLRDVLDRLDNLDTRGTGLLIPDGYVTAAMLAAGAIISTKYGTNSIPSTAYGDLTIGTSKLAVGCLSADAAGRAKMASAFIQNSHLSVDCVETLNLKTGSVTADRIADLNVTTQKLAAALAAVIQGTPAFTVGAEAANIIRVSVQLKDVSGANLAVPYIVRAWLSDTSGGPVTATTPSGGTVVGTAGVIVDSHQADKHLIIASDASGLLNLDITEAGSQTWYLNIEYAGKLFSSGAITFA